MWLQFLLGLVLCLSFYWFSFIQKPAFLKDQDASVDPKSSVLKPPDVEVPQPPSRSLLYLYEKAAVCSDKSSCSSIGRVILQNGGNSVDAVIATLLCNGLVTMQSMGLGGGVIMTFYERKTRKAVNIMGRERAPSNTKLKNMKQLNGTSFAKSALSIAVPGELAAYHEAHRRYGSLSWIDLMQPTIKICKQGYQITRHQRDALFLNEDMIRKDELLTQMFVDSNTNLFYREGWHIQFPPQVCATYKSLAEEGPLTFYNGSLASSIVADLNEMGSPIKLVDLHSFKAEVEESLKIDLEPYYIYLPKPPGSGHVVGFVMKMLHYFKKDFCLRQDLNALEIHRIIEALKFGFVKRWQYDTTVDYQTLQNLFETESLTNLTLLIDDFKTFNNLEHYGAEEGKLTSRPDHGTAQISVLAPNGDAVSATSSINYYFGSGQMGRRSGILFNNAMSDFTIDNFENYFNLPNIKSVNEIKARKQPMSSMAPLIVTTKKTGDVRFVIGAAGGSRIISSLVQILIRVLWQQQNIKQAIDAPRFHHQLVPNLLEYEFGMLQQVVKDLEERGHKTERVRRKSTAVCGIEKVEEGLIRANADYRKEGAVDGF